MPLAVSLKEYACVKIFLTPVRDMKDILTKFYRTVRTNVNTRIAHFFRGIDTVPILKPVQLAKDESQHNLKG